MNSLPDTVIRIERRLSGSIEKGLLYRIGAGHRAAGCVIEERHFRGQLLWLGDKGVRSARSGFLADAAVRRILVG